MFTIRRKAFFLTLLMLVGPNVGSVSLAEDQTGTQRARVYKAKPGEFLAARANTTPAALVANFVRSSGGSDATARSLRSVSEHRSPHTGVKHLRLEQQVAGLRVQDAYVKAAFNSRGELIHVIESLRPVGGAAPSPARIDDSQALAIALGNLYPDLQRQPSKTKREGNVTSFTKGDFFHDSPRVEQVAIPLPSGELAQVLTVQQLHRVIEQAVFRRAVVEHAHRVGVRQLRERSHLALEALQRGRAGAALHRLQRDL